MSIGIPIVNNKKNNKGKKHDKSNMGGFTIEFDPPEPIITKKQNPKSTINTSVEQTKEEKHHDLEFEDLFHTQSKELEAPSIEITHVHEEDTPEADATLFPSDAKLGIEDFELLKLVGRGAYGKVFQAKRKSTGEIFAIKILRKDLLIKSSNVEYTRAEKDILRRVKHPFIVDLHYVFQNDRRIYLVMDFVNGGQLFFHLREEAMFSEDVVRFYIAELVLALEFLHEKNIVHRDLKPENLLLDKHGHLVLTDFGFAKEVVGEGTRTFCGTREYLSPEMIEGKPYGISVDWWAVGILTYDLLTGEPPFRAKNEQTLYNKILKDKIRLPKYMSSDAHSLIKAFLNRDQSARLGTDGIAKIKSHPFFKKINWKKLANKEIEPPFKPTIERGALDTSNFDAEFTDVGVMHTPCDSLSSSQENLFKGFSYECTPDMGGLHISENNLSSSQKSENGIHVSDSQNSL